MQKAFRRKSRLNPEAFESLLDDIYAAGEDQRHWLMVLAGLTSQLSAPGGGLFAGGLGMGFSLGVLQGVNPVSMAVYAEYYDRINPLKAGLSRIPAGEAAPDHRLLAPEVFARSEYYNDFAIPYDMIGSITLVLSRDGRQEACLGVVRALGSDPFTDEQVAFVRRLGPHIRRAIGLNRRLAEMQNKNASLEAALGGVETAVFVIDSAGVICYCNAAGERLLDKRDGLTVSQGRLCADEANAQDFLAGLVKKALTAKGVGGGAFSVPRRCSARSLLVRVMPVSERSEYWLGGVQPSAILFVSDPDAPTGGADEVMDAYRLTRAEKKLLSELIAGRSLSEAADILNITRATSRNRLAWIMAKTDTHRQSELIQLILRSSVPVQ